MEIKELKIIIIYIFFLHEIKSDLISSVVNFQKQFDDFVEQTFSIFNENQIQNKYKEIYNDDGIEILPVNPLVIAKDFSHQLANEFRKKMESLKRAVDFAEEEARKYKWDPDIKASQVSYIDSKNLLENDTKLTEHSLFKTKVIANQSSVHIPTEIYNEEENILNTIKWTSKLDSIFSKNEKNLRYQYFASIYGVVTQYPGMKWRKTTTDMFDVRRRQWYVQGASSPKDVMILIDTSGSMHGISIKLTKAAVQKLIDTMGENDYIAVAQFPSFFKLNNTPHLLYDKPDIKLDEQPCFDTFVQANKRNKNRLFQQISSLKAKGIANLNDGLEFAIKEFHKFDNLPENWNVGANCNRLIVVFTDSGDEYDIEKIKPLMDKSKSTENLRIFIYYVGEEVMPIDLLTNKTCNYRGYFGHINSIGAVSSIIDKYSTVNHRHSMLGNLGVENEFRINLAPINNDGFHSVADFPPVGLGLMTSLTMPVYNRSGNGSFLGLLGTDMTVAFMDDLVPHNKLGPNGYAFAINTNGYIIFHPGLKNQLGWMRDPPNVDLIEIEFSSESKSKVRNKIIDCAASNGTQSGEDEVVSLIKIPDEIHTYEEVRTYSYFGVPLSTFVITIVNSKSNKFYPKFSSEIQFNNLIECTHLACSMTISLSNSKTVNVKFTNDVFVYAEENLINRCKLRMDKNDTIPQTSKELNPNSKKLQKSASHIVPITTMDSLQSNSISVLQNINISNSNVFTTLNHDNETNENELQYVKFSDQLLRIIDVLQKKSTDKCSVDDMRRIIIDLYIMGYVSSYLKLSQFVNSLIVTTFTGLSMVYPLSQRHVYKELFDNSTNSPIFQRAFDMKKIIFYTSFNRHSPPKNIPVANNSINSEILMFKEFSVTPLPHRSIPIAVLGLSLNHAKIMALMQNYSACNGNRFCFLIEDGGYVIGVNMHTSVSQIGEFFGDIQPVIMESLLNNSIFKRIEDYDYQAICPKEREEDTASSGDRLKPFINLLTAPLFIFKKLLFYSERLFISIKLLLHIFYLHFTSAQETTATDNKNVSCIKKFYRYYLEFQDTKPRVIDQICENSSLSYIAHKMKKSNLILISFNRSSSNNCGHVKISHVPRYPVKDEGTDICKLSRNPRYRLRPNYKCYQYDRNEDFSMCGVRNLHFLFKPYLIAFILTIDCLFLRDY